MAEVFLPLLVGSRQSQASFGYVSRENRVIFTSFGVRGNLKLRAEKYGRGLALPEASEPRAREVTLINSALWQVSLIERGTNAARQLQCIIVGPKVHEEQTRRLVEHVAV